MDTINEEFGNKMRSLRKQGLLKDIGIFFKPIVRFTLVSLIIIGACILIINDFSYGQKVFLSNGQFFRITPVGNHFFLDTRGLDQKTKLFISSEDGINTVDLNPSVKATIDITVNNNQK